MTLPRKLEPEVMDTREEAAEYDSMDHSAVNQAFARDLVDFVRGCSSWLDEGEEIEVLDLGTGTARIPIELCKLHAHCRVVGVDLSTAMLDLARYNVEAAGFPARILLAHVDAKSTPFAADRFPIVVSNSIVHHIPEPASVFAEAARLAAPRGVIFIRDLLRPPDEATLEEIVRQYAGEENARQQAMFADSLHAALTLQEVRSLVAMHGYAADCVQATSDRHWTWAAVAPE